MSIQGLDEYAVAGFPDVDIVLDAGYHVLVVFGEDSREGHLLVANVDVLHARWQFEGFALARQKIVYLNNDKILKKSFFTESYKS